MWSRDGARTVRRAIAGFRPDVVHFHNTFPLLSPAALRAAHGTGVRRRPDAPQLPSALPGGDVPARRPGVRGLPRAASRSRRSSTAATGHPASRRSRSRVKDALHSAIGTWSTAVDTYITPSEFARSRYLKAGWPADRIVVKYNTAPDPGTPRPAYDGGFVCLSRLAPEKGVDVLLEAWAQAFPDGGAAAARSSARASWRQTLRARAETAVRGRVDRPGSARARTRDPRRSPRARRAVALVRGLPADRRRGVRARDPGDRLAARQPGRDRRRRRDRPPLRARRRRPTSRAPSGAWPTTATSSSASAQEPAASTSATSARRRRPTGCSRSTPDPRQTPRPPTSAARRGGAAR